mmetsp:Transcript_19706/g.41332  ORF Transcript_19706/g.41332 Transcript_19706/m.41332 type:complete len:259 (+) Transcript_19706:20-796(+)
MVLRVLIAALCLICQNWLVSCDPSNLTYIESAAPSIESSSDTSSFVQVILAIVVGFGGFVVFFCRGGKKKFKGDAVFLVGSCDGGKTSLFFRLRDGLKNGNLRGTHTSMITNEATFAVVDDQDSEQKPVRFIDFPGHRRLRPLLFANLEDCRAVIVVIDACTFSHQAREIAELILDLLTSTALMKHGQRMLVLCNKIDAMPDDLAGIEAKKMVRKRLESEVESLRVSRASGLGETDASAVRVELEIAGSNFRWSDSPL